jgi:hypothetical protein
MAGVITTGSTPKLLWPGLNQIWGMAYKTKTPEWSELFPTFMSEKNYEEDVGLTGMGLAPVKPETDALMYDTMKQTFVTKYTNVAYSIGFVITREEIADNLYAQFGAQRSRNVAFSMMQSKENVAANIFNRAFNGSYVGGDAVSLVSASHPTEGGLLSNSPTVAVDLSEAALEDALVDISQFRDNRNNLINVMAQCLVVPPQLQFEATRLLKNPQRPGTADRDISAMYAMGLFPQGIKVNHYFTDSDAWFILTDCPTGLKHFQRQAPKFEADNDFDTKNAKFSGYERYSFGWTDWRAVYGSPGV